MPFADLKPAQNLPAGVELTDGTGAMGDPSDSAGVNGAEVSLVRVVLGVAGSAGGAGELMAAVDLISDSTA